MYILPFYGYAHHHTFVLLQTAIVWVQKNYLTHYLTPKNQTQ